MCKSVCARNRADLVSGHTLNRLYLTTTVTSQLSIYWLPSECSGKHKVGLIMFYALALFTVFIHVFIMACPCPLPLFVQFRRGKGCSSQLTLQLLELTQHCHLLVMSTNDKQLKGEWRAIFSMLKY